MRYLITGHTGFKGAWLALMLAQQGHELHGLALDPLPGGLYDAASVSDLFASDTRLDIREAPGVEALVARVRPEVVVHLAAQPLVRESYREPVSTVLTNAIGTMNLLEATRKVDSVRAQLIVTTDKVYRNTGSRHGYEEGDALGGEDPYSSSKSMADLLTQSWLASLDCPPTAIARAGNVIGGGDVSADRLLPDLLAGFSEGRPVLIRCPQAIRPWQHVLDCLQGYVTLLSSTLDRGLDGAWNFGPDPSHSRSVAEVADLAASLWGPEALWEVAAEPQLPEAGILILDSSKARRELLWRDRLGFHESIAWTVEWARARASGGDARVSTNQQIERFLALG